MQNLDDKIRYYELTGWGSCRGWLYWFGVLLEEYRSETSIRFGTRVELLHMPSRAEGLHQLGSRRLKSSSDDELSGSMTMALHSFLIEERLLF